MFPKKVAKREEQSNSSLTFHLKSTYPKGWYEGFLNIVSIDPGIANFGFRLETRMHDGRINTAHMLRKCFSKEMIVNGSYCSLYSDVTSFLNQFIDLFMQCHVFIIERQIPENYQSVRLSQHVISYFISLLSSAPLQPLLVEIDPMAKYKCLGAPKGFNKTALKQWGIQYAKELLRAREDHDTLSLIEGTKGVRGQKKQDDLCDTIIQVEAFWKLFPIPVTKH